MLPPQRRYVCGRGDPTKGKKGLYALLNPSIAGSRPGLRRIFDARVNEYPFGSSWNTHDSGSCAAATAVIRNIGNNRMETLLVST